MKLSARKCDRPSAIFLRSAFEIPMSIWVAPVSAWAWGGGVLTDLSALLALAMTRLRAGDQSHYRPPNRITNPFSEYNRRCRPPNAHNILPAPTNRTTESCIAHDARSTARWHATVDDCWDCGRAGTRSRRTPRYRPRSSMCLVFPSQPAQPAPHRCRLRSKWIRLYPLLARPNASSR